MVIASGLLLITLTCYAALCAARPFGPCRKCAGTGQREHHGKTKTCRRCHGQRNRLRLGRRAWSAWQRTRDGGTQPGR